MNNLTLKLFGAVLDNQTQGDFVVDTTNGLVITPSASYAKNEVISFYEYNRLNGQDLNKTFHKSWNKVISSTRAELAVDQVLHYLSTYGNAFGDFVYIPNETLNVPKLEGIKFLVVDTLSKDEAVAKSIQLLESGIALKEDTILDILNLLNQLDYDFTDVSNIRNKEAMIFIAQKTGVYPKDPVELLRMAVFKATESTLLIKNEATIDAIKNSNYSIGKLFNTVGHKKMSTIFNRFKPLFLAFKKANKSNVFDINKISRHSKFSHEPLVSNPLNTATSQKIYNKDLHWLSNATPFALFKALNALHSRIQGREHFGYKVRNGKAFFKQDVNTQNKSVWAHNYKLILNEIKNRVKGDNKTVYIPESIQYALPTSEKMFLGNIPIGTKVTADKIAGGFYWENSWGAIDLDLSGITVNAKIGWNSGYHSNNVTYSGDITSASDGAVEYLLAQGNSITEPVLAFNNVYEGETNSGFKIIVGEGDNINYQYMLNPNKLVLEAKTETVSKGSIIGLFLPEDGNKVSYTVFNFGVSRNHVSGTTDNSKLFLKSLIEEYTTQLYINDLLKEVGFNIVHKKTDDQEIDFDLTPEKLERDTFISLFNKNK